MILQITHPAQLRGAIGQDLLRCFKAYCDKANDGATVASLATILPMRVYPENAPPTAWLFLGFDEKMRVRAFALMRLVKDDHEQEWTAQFWHVYVDPKAPPGLFDGGFRTIQDYFRGRGITRLQFCSSRYVNGQAWERMLKDYGFKAVATIYEVDTKEGGRHGFSADRPGIDGHGDGETGRVHGPDGESPPERSAS